MKVDKEGLDKRLEEMEEEMESAVLDREVEVERREEAVAELEAEREKLAELQVELGVLKGDREGSVVPSGDGDANEDGEPKSSLDYIQLEKQNERLKDALIRSVVFQFPRTCCLNSIRFA